MSLPNYKKAMELDTTKAEYIAAYARGPPYEPTILLFKKAISLDSTYGGAYAGLGYSYNKLGRIKEAYDMYCKAVEIDPTNIVWVKSRENMKRKLENK